MKGNVGITSFASQEQSKTADSKEILCSKLYVLLRPVVKHWVYTAHISSWLGQQEDIVEDIVQETLLKILIYLLRAEKGEVAQIKDIEHFALVIAHNYCRDLQRKDQRLERYEMYDRTLLEQVVKSRAVDPAEIALKHVYNVWVFLKLANFVVTIPTKQRTALLRDLAQRMSFGNSPTPLQGAFADKGMELRAYHGWRGENKREQSQHASNLSLALRQIKVWAANASL